MSVISVQNGDVYVSSQDEVGQIAGNYATQSYVNTAISDLIDGAPGTLDTLNELAAALQDDANFASTVVLKAGSTMTGDLILNADPTVALGAATKQYVDNTTGGVINLDDLADVTSGIPTGVRHVLWYEGNSVGGATPKWSSQELNLNDSMFANLAITSLADNDILKYDSSTSKWINSDTLNIKQVLAEATVYNEVSAFNRLNNTDNYAVASIEVERDMTTSALSTGLDERGAGFSFTIKQDSLPFYQNSIYPGIFFGKSGGSAQSALVENTVGMSVYSGPNDTPSYTEIKVIEGNRNNATVYPKLNTEKGIKNVADNYSEIAAFESKTLAPNNTVGIELQRNLSTDGAVSGRDTRGVAQLYAIYSDSGNTNGSATAIYPGGLVGQSGSNDGTSPHWLKAFTYDDGVSSFSEETIWEGTKDEFHVYPPTEFHAPVQLPVYADNTARDAAITSPAAGMTILNGTTFQGYNGSSWVNLN